jgi:excisionase family DNA binding protein
MQTQASKKTRASDTETEDSGEQPLINVGEAAEYLGVSAASLRKWCDKGLVAFYRTPGGQRRFSHADLEKFKDSMRRPSRVEPRSARDGAKAGSQTRRQRH